MKMQLINSAILYLFKHSKVAVTLSRAFELSKKPIWVWWYHVFYCSVQVALNTIPSLIRQQLQKYLPRPELCLTQ
jgi:hypothetical protein